MRCRPSTLIRLTGVMVSPVAWVLGTLISNCAAPRTAAPPARQQANSVAGCGSALPPRSTMLRKRSMAVGAHGRSRAGQAALADREGGTIQGRRDAPASGVRTHRQCRPRAGAQLTESSPSPLVGEGLGRGGKVLRERCPLSPTLPSLRSGSKHRWQPRTAAKRCRAEVPSRGAQRASPLRIPCPALAHSARAFVGSRGSAAQTSRLTPIPNPGSHFHNIPSTLRNGTSARRKASPLQLSRRCWSMPDSPRSRSARLPAPVPGSLHRAWARLATV
jgi:hypothetical protein